MADVNWSELYQQRKHIASRFGDIWAQPIEKRYSSVLARLAGPYMSVLEVGAGDRSLLEKLKGHEGLTYQSCDIDQSFPHEYAHIDDVEGQFDLVCGFEVIEHMPLEAARHFLAQCYRVTSPGGIIMLTTPNIYYPPAFLRDATHITAFAFDELAGLLAMVGYEVTDIYRLYHDSLIKRFLRRFLFYGLFRLLGIDFSRQIMVVGKKLSQSA
jgi:SAM-dependent methyltransferase